MKTLTTCLGQTLMALTLLLAAGMAPAAHHEAKKDIVETAVDAGTFTTLVAAVQAAELVDTLKGTGPFTLFAPTDGAFARLPAGTVDNLLRPENKDQLVAILTYHVVAGNIMAADAIKLDSATTVQGGTVSIQTQNGNVKVNDATVLMADLEASNGVIHIIDRVLMP
ncbi:fasciclin domain-containing protein [Zobellella maritima]|uniref:fasciclin domain-containing protein n=1 Tax=Zobellella maritima TaxID=2059725 RepID=UPI0018E554DE|nr:fasciclin domain-containing protein [Zobellella maritima]